MKAVYIGTETKQNHKGSDSTKGKKQAEGWFTIEQKKKEKKEA